MMVTRKFEEHKTTYTCQCGHRIDIPKNRGKRLCKWCGKYVFIDKKDEFRYKLLERGRMK